jgi:hypothetical protein
LFLKHVSYPASGRYPWTATTFRRHGEYIAALEAASVQGDIKPFARVVGGIVGRKYKPEIPKVHLRKPQV